MFLLNAFSLNMLNPELIHNVRITPCTLGDARWELAQEVDGDIFNGIGHPDTDRVVREELRLDHVPQGERSNVRLNFGDSAIIAQYVGPRLKEGATSLPEGAEIKYFRVDVL